jgi:succinyl-diaminopimelate desuccinylase
MTASPATALPAAQRVLAALDRDYLVWLLARLVEFPSVSPPCRLGPIATFVAEEFRAQGLQTTVAGDLGDGWERPNVLAVLPGTSEEWGLILSAHTDVVPPYDLADWRFPPFEARIEDGTMYGRGTADCKGSLAAMMAAARALAGSGIPLARGVAVLAWAGDEWHPPGARWFNGETFMATNGFLRRALYIGGEPYDLQICCASRGRVWVRALVRGIASHSASGAGVNAILGTMQVIRAIYAYPRQIDPILGEDTVNAGTIKGGVQTNMVPDECTVTFDVRFACPRTVAQVREWVEKAVAASLPAGTVSGYQLVFPESREPIAFPADGQLVGAMQHAARLALGRGLPLGGAVSFGDIADWKDRAGIHEACLFGPGDTRQAHAVNEHVRLGDVEAAAAVYALTALACAEGGG